MSKRDNSNVGYGHPPNGTRFKPGRSGNPKGRPKGARSLKTAVARLMKKRVAIREDGERRHVSGQEALLLTLYASALKGDSKALHQLLMMVAKLESQDAAPAQPDVVTENDCAIIEGYLRRNSAKEVECES